MIVSFSSSLSIVFPHTEQKIWDLIFIVNLFYQNPINYDYSLRYGYPFQAHLPFNTALGQFQIVLTVY